MSLNTVRNLEQVLIDQCKAGQRSAQRELYERYAKAMYNLCTRMLGDPADAKDALQEAFIDAFRGIDRFKGESTFGAWLKRIVVNRCITMLQKQQKLQWVSLDEQEMVDEVVEEEVPKWTPTQVNAAIKQLPVKARAVFTLYCMEGYDHGEIAQILSISVGTSKSQYNRARHLLRETLNAQQS